VQGEPLYRVDQINGIVNPFNRKSIQFAASDELKIRDWAVDQQSQTAAGGGDVVIDGIPYVALYGIERNDVAEGRKVPGYRDCGFQFWMPAGRLAPGVHTLSLRIVARDRKFYYQGAGTDTGCALDRRSPNT
jgi:hypothetical protein